jgi:hypothetical protein
MRSKRHIELTELTTTGLLLMPSEILTDNTDADVLSVLSVHFSKRSYIDVCSLEE